ncbi:MAG: hypothetical protein ACRDFX_02030 [Chloroflexota bacterium]
MTKALVPGLLAGALLAGGLGSAFAAPARVHAHRVGAYGQVSNVSSTGFTLTRTPKKATTTTPKSVQVILNSSTKEHARKGTTGTTLANGEYAFVAGTKTTAGFTANQILFSSTKFNARKMILRIKLQRILNALTRGHRAAKAHGAVGAVASSSATSLVITTAKGKTLTFAITATTKYRVNKQLTTTTPIFTSGEKVRVMFARNASTKTLTARVINVVPVA